MGGIGLGLAICKSIVEGLGGKTWFESEENKGTRFYFTIPKNKESNLTNWYVLYYYERCSDVQLIW